MSDERITTSPNKPCEPQAAPAELGPGVLWDALKIGAGIGIFLGLPLALLCGAGYGPTALGVGVGSAVLWLWVFVALHSESLAARALGKLFAAILLLAFGVGVVATILLKIEADQRKSAPAPVRPPVHVPIRVG